MPSAKLLRHPLLLLGLGFMLQMCASSADSTGSSGAAGTSAGAGGSSTVDGGSCVVVEDCALPPSHCDASGNALVYYTGAFCVSNACVFSEQRISCRCSNGGCVGSGTAGGILVTTAGGVSTSGPVTSGGGISTSGPVSTVGGLGGISGNAGESGAGGVDRDASGDAPSDASLQACRLPSDCMLPPSYCKDAETLVFAQQPTCNAHLCEFTFSETKCRCVGNGCIGTSTK
jgi:hypothetical protein